MTFVKGISRRYAMGYGAASLLLAPRALHAQQAGDQADSDKVEAASDDQNHLTIEVTIDGKGPFAFVVDTGADRTVISDEVANVLGLNLGPQVNVQGVVRSVLAQTVRLNRLSFGQFERENLVVPVLPRTLLRASGYLGLDVIDGTRVTFDFKDRTLEIAQPRPRFMTNYVPPYEARIAAMGRYGHLRAVNCRVDGIATTTFLDSGAEISLGNSKLFAALMERDPKYATPLTVPISGVTGGFIDGRVTTIHQMRFGSLVFGTCDIAIADMEIFDIWGLSERPALLIGMNFLRGFDSVAIDYGLKELRFDMASLVMARSG
jgi:predicted aspartyl protease